MTVFGTLTDFLATRKKDLSVLLFVWLLLVGIKYFFPEIIAKSRFRSLAEIAIVLCIPLGVLWEWRKYKKSKNTSMMGEEHDAG